LSASHHDVSLLIANGIITMLLSAGTSYSLLNRQQRLNQLNGLSKVITTSVR